MRNDQEDPRHRMRGGGREYHHHQSHLHAARVKTRTEVLR